MDVKCNPLPGTAGPRMGTADRIPPINLSKSATNAHPAQRVLRAFRFVCYYFF